MRLQATRRVDSSRYQIVKVGCDFKTTGVVNMKLLSTYMDRNEAYVFWLQPLGGALEEQVPAIRVNGTLYHINMRLEKAIFRHVRLSRNFHNVESLEDGTLKLRIPTRLLREKQRTSTRHMVSHGVCAGMPFPYLIVCVCAGYVAQEAKGTRRRPHPGRGEAARAYAEQPAVHPDAVGVGAGTQL